jgi:hypothetical protein
MKASSAFLRTIYIQGNPKFYEYQYAVSKVHLDDDLLADALLNLLMIGTGKRYVWSARLPLLTEKNSTTQSSLEE